MWGRRSGRAIMRPMEPLPIQVQPGARFECHRCGACCRRELGVEVSEAEVARYADVDWRPEGTRFEAGYVVRDKGPDGERLRLRTVEGRCIFLDKDELCIIHKRLGYAGKPTRCRAFPLRFASTPGGVQASVSPECQGLHRSYLEGPLVAEQPDLRELAEASPRLMIVGSRFILCNGRPPELGWDDVQAVLEDAAAQAAADGGGDSPVLELPWAVRRAVVRALGGPPPPTPWEFEGPPDVPFYQCLDYAGEHLAPLAGRYGLSLIGSALAVMRRYHVWKSAAEALDPAGAAYLRHVLACLISELRPLQLGQVAAGLGSALYLAMGCAAGAAKIAEVERGGDARPTAAEVGRVADEAAELYRLRETVEVMDRHLLAFERLVFDAPAPVR